MNKPMTTQQQSRQKARNANGKYEKHNECYLCNKSAGAHYFSHPLTDCDGSDGKPFHDIALCLCVDCESATHNMTTVAEIKNYKASL